MKFKTTAKAIREGGGVTLKIPYCDAQNLLEWNHSPVAYTCGVYGWNFDVYTVHGVTICTGYRGMVGKPVSHELTARYENAAEAIRYDREMDYEEKREAVEKLLVEFIKEATA